MASEKRLERTWRRLCSNYLDHDGVPGIVGVAHRHEGHSDDKLVLNYKEDMRWRSYLWLQASRWVLWQPIQLQKSGYVHALQGRTGKWDVLPGGTSGGGENVTAGTNGFRGYIKLAGETVRVMVTNWHVAIGTNGSRSDKYLQPGVVDGGTEHWGNVVETSGVDFSGNPNEFDRASIRPLADASLGEELLENGPYPTEVVKLVVGDTCDKEGRTSGVTVFKVDQTGGAFDIGYGGGNVGRFVNQNVFVTVKKEGRCPFPFLGSFICDLICRFAPSFCEETEPPLKGGDSGSMVRRINGDEIPKFGGQAFAGSDTIGIGNPETTLVAGGIRLTP